VASLLEEFLNELNEAAPAVRKAAIEAAVAHNGKLIYIPNPGPQTEAWYCEADELFFGGGAGGGKSSLLCGLAIEQHTKSIIFRREFPQIKGLIDETSRILGTRNGYNGQEKIWRLPKGNELEFGSCQHEDDKEKYQGRDHDLKGFDEITHFTESQYRFLIGWNRTTKKGQRSRVVATGNPPFTAVGLWVIKYWGPWLDPEHPRPAKPGELRWFIVVDNNDVEVDGPGPHLVNGKQFRARSRTFIPAKLEDNPDLMMTGYAAVIESMQEPMRTMMREGRFDVGMKDSNFQVIPTSWILAAQARWDTEGWRAHTMTAMAMDMAGGGEDSQELAYRHHGWYGPLDTLQGEETADGKQAAAAVVRRRKHRAPVVIDVGGGYGGALKLVLDENGVAHIGFNGAAGSTAKTKDGQLKFVNKRAEAWWRFREALDPDQEGGSIIALPPGTELRADLAAPTYTVGVRGILLESKDELRKRLGRSPGKGDAVVMCWSEGDKAVARATNQYQTLQTTANVSRANLKKRR
jgi:hypothetical protein